MGGLGGLFDYRVSSLALAWACLLDWPYKWELQSNFNSEESKNTHWDYFIILNFVCTSYPKWNGRTRRLEARNEMSAMHRHDSRRLNKLSIDLKNKMICSYRIDKYFV